MASTITPTLSPSCSSSTPKGEYEVFLSFHGPDTRKRFTDHLYHALKEKGIHTFRDDKTLKQGEYISEGLLKAIQESTYVIVVISKSYAFSKWCLIELAEIVRCKKEMRLIVVPVFYNVDPSDVREQTRSFAKAFVKHEKDPKVGMKTIQTWRAALTEVGSISGWNLEADRSEAVTVREITSRISGITGTSGIGKTTLVEVIYDKVCKKFEASCFIGSIRQQTINSGVVSLQKKLLSKILEEEVSIRDDREGLRMMSTRLRSKRVIIVLDDVDKEEQLEALARSHDWFGRGSRIIITSKYYHLLKRYVNLISRVKHLNDDESLQLFNLSAFKKPHPENSYVDLSKKFARYAQGLPVALKVLGSFLFGRTTDAWQSAWDQLQENPRRILNALQIGFDGLDDMQRELFLHMACFFNGKKVDDIRDVLEGLSFNPLSNIEALVERSLINISTEGFINMPDSLQKMAQEIVDCESPNEPGQRSRLWRYEDVLRVLKDNSGTDAVEGIILNSPIEIDERLSVRAFSKMKKLKILKIGSINGREKFSPAN